ncbi:helix-turn-helix domain-containing protein [Frigidibacter sp. MR17.14]|uniref:GlxA family transcriptional regulator n=1 Tax=Frigidibacter sp. MR17.14 TaxID=3126509 RepID=UPI00301301A6
MPALHPHLSQAQGPFRVAILVLPGTPALALGGLADPLAARDDMTVQVVTPNGRPVRLASGGELVSRVSLKEAEGDCLIVLAAPDGDPRDHARSIARASARFPILGAVGGGIAFLAQAGLLEGRTVTCPIDPEGQPMPFTAPARLRFAETAIRLDGDRVTAAAPGSAASLALALVEARAGRDAAAGLARSMGLESPPETLPDPAGESEAPRPEAADPRVAAAIARMRASIANPPSAAEIARDLNLSPRRLEGLFRAEFGTGPGGYGLNLRLDAARAMLLETRLAVAEVAHATGFSSAGTLARAFRGRFSQSPSELRRVTISETNHGLARRP